MGESGRKSGKRRSLKRKQILEAPESGKKSGFYSIYSGMSLEVFVVCLFGLFLFFV